MPISGISNTQSFPTQQHIEQTTLSREDSLREADQECGLTRSSLSSSPSIEMAKVDSPQPSNDYATSVIPYEEVYSQAMQKAIIPFRREVPDINTYVILLKKVGLDDPNIQIFLNRLPSKEARDFLTLNLDMLERELDRLFNKEDPNAVRYQYARYQRLLNQYYTSDKLKPEEMITMNKDLAQLESELKHGVKLIQEKLIKFQVHSNICREIELGNIKGLPAIDLCGIEHFQVEEKTEQSLRDCKLVSNFFRHYLSEVLDPHLTYFTKFLSEVLLFKSQVNAVGWLKI